MRELVLYCREEQAEAWSDLLLDAGVLSVSVEDAESDTDAEHPLFGEPGTEPQVQAWRNNRVVALLPDHLEPAEVVSALADATGEVISDTDWVTQEVPDADWVRVTQSQFGPIHVGERIVIVPSWHVNDPSLDLSDNVVAIELDPGLAFGTGSHPTTHLCLEWLAENLQGAPTVLDYGCGSGILAIAARKLGAASVYAIDIDEQAVIATGYNAQVNQVELNAGLPDDLPEGRFDLVVANILSNPLKVLAPMLANRVAQGGRLVLSGVLERQADEVAAAYAPWLAMSVWQSREGWVCLHGQR
ncbi:MAG TPA: 50S ribosomal protein L11 methyltransferase [Pusillimonas sp.]|jgi:ribosomal protein L11 methyltransferase|nr:50S ribosomal protein L11 methyltransferase [Pusillimonas sp.]MBC41164.1 50S ribosomal protein L11 methyltransferase [Pusillimonas sp.]HBT32335.1 50S ribosomal protein L11 methyltransferase [Pusillimonas sp.]|tara:strand:+ start:123914 stop:124816 length:903 start_codon:yes stop_codon:yes gene_type:complete